MKNVPNLSNDMITKLEALVKEKYPMSKKASEVELVSGDILCSHPDKDCIIVTPDMLRNGMEWTQYFYVIGHTRTLDAALKAFDLNQ
ncbi:hypothetical protein AB4455_07875 [Vibrio sp. 10N.261.46.E12]|uniref:hypothetical protein n=1 Tax=unclassified Vibrio TaxID=2614977 RepID=UPI000977E302|nr:MULTISPECIES: hypothetical protein [unclassified Vibrio]OMO34459.1 hypothetical protein BH584_12590 [Vibrio sp. 10N.261.45.E1]PMJ26218.1 hypothetical protein BCU27_09695 [Vibrio sp. 10N.286.45.B6]PML82788.1 hypothetical protein BCT66_20070 [Vibrio sp. 10N.261.49.E11]PMM90312.1 hypothetical protein BCT46_23495 [Vibrio sp. 10N.261.46.E8]PMN43932.1 hypothetical protein BCT32_00775 [Vibrio sp. 10N.261.45.E11]